MNSIKLWFIVNWELFCRWMNRKEEYKYTIAFFIGMYFREKNQSNNATKDELDKIGIVDIDYSYQRITIYCLNTLRFRLLDFLSLQTYLKKNVKEFNGIVVVQEYKNKRIDSLHSYKCVCKDFDGNDDIQYDF